MKIIANRIIAFVIILITCYSCTDLQEIILDEDLTGGVESQGSTTIEGYVAACYRAYYVMYQRNPMMHMQFDPSDAGMMATRDQDWWDGGRYHEMHKHTWTTQNPVILRAWNDIQTGIARCIETLSLLNKHSVGFSEYKAEIWAIYSSLMILSVDFWNIVLYRDPDDYNFTDYPEIKNGPEAIDFAIAKLEEILSDLPDKGGAGIGNGRFTKEAAKGMLARAYLNRAVYKDTYASSFDFSNADMIKVIDYCNDLIASPKFSLETENYFSIFDDGNSGHKEHILASEVREELNNPFSTTSLRSNMMSRAQYPYPGRRGSDSYCIIPEFFDLMDFPDDPRTWREYLPQDGSVTSIPESEYKLNMGFLIGQQYGAVMDPAGGFKKEENGELVIEALISPRNQQPVIFTRETGITTGQNNGIRVAKWGWSKTSFGRGPCVPIIRLGDVYLMLAEALYRKGETTSALNVINELRTARDTYTRESISLEGILLERAQEMYFEFSRRPDQIRFGTFENTWLDKTVSDVNKRRFPIPLLALDANKHLPEHQNPGY